MRFGTTTSRRRSHGRSAGNYDYAEIIDDGDWVLVNQTRSLRGRASGVEVEFSYWLLFTFEDGLIRQQRWFDSKAEALEAVGPAGVGDESGEHGRS